MHLHGNSFTKATDPPTIRVASFLTPHSQVELVGGSGGAAVVGAGGGGGGAAVVGATTTAEEEVPWMTVRVHWNL